MIDWEDLICDIRRKLGLLPSLESVVDKKKRGEEWSLADTYAFVYKSKVSYMNPTIIGATKANILKFEGPMTLEKLDKRVKELEEEEV